MFFGRNIPRKSATGAFIEGAKEIVRATEKQTKALKAKAKESPKDQHGRFVEIAKEVGADTHMQEFDEAFRKVVKPKG